MAKKASVASVVPRYSPYFNQERSLSLGQRRIKKALPAGSAQARSSYPAKAPSKTTHELDAERTQNQAVGYNHTVAVE